MRKVKNQEIIKGYIYEHKLAIKTVQNKESDNFGKPYIAGTIDIATDEDCTNVITVHYTFVKELTSKGNKNASFGVLKNIIENGKTVLSDGKENATIVKCDTSLDVNDFISNRDGNETYVAVKRNEGGFITTLSKFEPDKRNYFDVDMYINKVKDIEANPEKGIEKPYLQISGYVFNFKGALLPVDFVCKDENGIKYFLSKNISKENPLFTGVWGNIVNATLTREVQKENAFGGVSVEREERNVREWQITGAKPVEYVLGDPDNGITADEMKKAQADREVHLAEVKKRNDEYLASKNAAPANGFAVASAPAAAGGFNF